MVLVMLSTTSQPILMLSLHFLLSLNATHSQRSPRLKPGIPQPIFSVTLSNSKPKLPSPNPAYQCAATNPSCPAPPPITESERFISLQSEVTFLKSSLAQVHATLSTSSFQLSSNASNGGSSYSVTPPDHPPSAKRVKVEQPDTAIKSEPKSN